MSINVAIIRETFEHVKPVANEVITQFYETLFQNYPEAKTLFKKTKMKEQKQALIKALAFIVENVDNPDKLVPYLQKMGGRHVKYGTEPEHYSWVGQSLLDTFGAVFGTSWTAEAEESWTAAIEFIAQTMLSGASGKKSQNMPAKAAVNPVDSIAKDLANNILRSYLETFDTEIATLAKERAKKILIKSLEEEASKMMRVKKAA